VPHYCLIFSTSRHQKASIEGRCVGKEAKIDLTTNTPHTKRDPSDSLAEVSGLPRMRRGFGSRQAEQILQEANRIDSNLVQARARWGDKAPLMSSLTTRMVRFYDFIVRQTAHG